MKNILLYLALITLLVGCNKDDATTEDSGSNTGLLKNRNIEIDGKVRNYHLYIPQDATNAPVVLLLHGNKSNYDYILGIGRIGFNTEIIAPYKVWLDLAEEENIVLIVPNGTEGPDEDNGWNDCRSDATGNPDSNDVVFISNLIDFVVDEYQADSSKVFVVGTSNGGHMAIRLAQEMPNKLKAFASIVAANPKNSQCVNSTSPISALFMNGTEDPYLPDAGGPMNPASRGEVFSAQETIAYWVDRNQANSTPIVTDLQDTDTSDNCTVKKYLYTNGANNTEVVFYEVANGGHTEPSIAERYGNGFKALAKEQNGDIEMAIEVWNFFKTK